MRPLRVSTAVTLLWASLALGIVTSLLDVRFLTSVAAPGFTVGILVVVFLVTAWLVVKISAGRNWARLTFLVLFLVGAVPYALSLAAMFERRALAGAVSVVQFALQICALYLIFTRPGADWFSRKGGS